MFDTYHTIYRNEVSSDYVYRFKEDLRHVHLADNGRLQSGEGDEFPPLIAALQNTGFNGYLTMEIGFNRRDVDPDALARRAPYELTISQPNGRYGSNCEVTSVGTRPSLGRGQPSRLGLVTRRGQ